LVIKAILLFFAVQTFTTISQDYGGVLSIWERWDATHYVHLAEHGYAGAGKDRVLLAFFPLYPWLVRTAAVVLRDPLLAAFFVSAAASIAAALLLRTLAALDERPAVARSAVWFFAIFPTAYFLHIPYTESLFLALTLGCVLAVRSDHWMLAGLLGGCASLTRINGMLLLPVCGGSGASPWPRASSFISGSISTWRAIRSRSLTSKSSTGITSSRRLGSGSATRGSGSGG
jgi:Gpi18-like mannosyltransferase